VEPTRCDRKLTAAGVRVTAGAVPVPLNATACGLPAASSVICALALRAPVTVGEKVAVIVQVAFTASDPGQSFVRAKSAAFPPVSAIPVIVSGAVPVFFKVDDCGALVVPTSCDPNARLVGVSVTAGAGAPPVPPRVRACGLSAALSETWTLATRDPVALGENVTVIVQVAFAATEAGQSFV